MKTIAFMPKIPEMPMKLTADIKSAVRTMALTRKIEADLASGMSIENVLASHLPATDKDTVLEAARQLEKGISDVYGSLGDKVDNRWITEKLNEGMLNLDGTERVKYLKNMVEATAGADLSKEIRERIDAVDENANEEDLAFLIDVANGAITRRTDILCRASVQAMNSSLNKIDRKTVRALTEAGVEKAKAYAAACYLLNQCGENPWCTGEATMEDKDPYAIGAIAAANIEASKIMTLFYHGKITLDVLKLKLQSLFRSVITFVCRHTVRAAAKVIQIVIFAKVAVTTVEFLFDSLMIGPWVAIIGGSLIALFVATKVITTQDLVDIMNAAWHGIKAAWNAAKNLLNRLLTGAIESAEADEEEEEDEDEAAESEEYADEDATL